SGSLLRLGNTAISGPVVDLWRAPTDNDIGAGLDKLWHSIGLHRLHQRVLDVESDEDGLTGRVRGAPAATGLPYDCVLHWRAHVSDVGEWLRLALTGTPTGDWPSPLPRFGVRFALPSGLGASALRRVTWVGYGPGVAYCDTRSGVRFGRFAMSV